MISTAPHNALPTNIAVETGEVEPLIRRCTHCQRHGYSHTFFHVALAEPSVTISKGSKSAVSAALAHMTARSGVSKRFTIDASGSCAPHVILS